MPEHRGAFGAARPVLARPILTGGESRAVRLRASEDIVLVGLIAATVDRLSLLGERGLLVQLVTGAVQAGHAGGNRLALGVLPRTLADAIAGVGGRLTPLGLGREIGAPGVRARAGTGGLSERLALLVGAGEAAEISALARAGAGDEERHGARRPLRTRDGSEG